MKTFAFACLAAVALAKQTHRDVSPRSEPAAEVVEVEPDQPKAEPTPTLDKYQKLAKVDFYLKHIWLGCYQGLYGMGHVDERPSDECFGEWIPDHLREIGAYFHGLKSNFWNTSYDDSMNAAYDYVDLLFLNDEYCLFRKTWWDVRAFCHQPGNCVMKDVFANL